MGWTSRICDVATTVVEGGSLSVGLYALKKPGSSEKPGYLGNLRTYLHAM